MLTLLQQNLNLTLLRYSYALVEPMSQTGVQAAEESYQAGSMCYVNAAYYTAPNQLFVPRAISYRVDDVASGYNIVPWTTLPQESRNTITVTGAENYIVDQARTFEQHQITVAVTDQTGVTAYQPAVYTIMANSFTPPV